MTTFFKYLLLVLILNFTLTHNILKAQNEGKEHETTLVLFKKNGLFGYMNLNKEVVISERYLFAGDFSNNGFAKAMEPYSTFGYINKKGEYSIEPEYTLATSFIGNYAFVYDNNSFYRINKLGEKLNTYDKRIHHIDFTHFAYSDTIVFTTKSNLAGRIDIEGNIITEPIYQNIIPLINNSYAFILEKNNKIIYYTLDSKQNRTDYSKINMSKNWVTGSIEIMATSTDKETEIKLNERYEFYQKHIQKTKNNQNFGSSIFERHILMNMDSLVLKKKPFITAKMLEANKDKFYFNDSNSPFHGQMFLPLRLELGHPYSSVNTKYPLSFDTIPNLYKNDSLIMSEESIKLYPKSSLFYVAASGVFITELEIFNQDAWITPIKTKTYSIDGISSLYQKIDTSFAYVFSKEKYSNLKGDIKTKARLVCKVKDKNNKIKRITSESFDLNIHSYLLNSLNDKMLNSMLNQ